MSNLLQNISWTQYLLFVGALLVFYYAAVLLLYFRKNIWDKLNPVNRTGEKEIEQEQELFGDDPEAELSEDLKQTKKDIGHSILVPGNKATHNELLEQLKVRVANFGGLSRPGYRYALNDYIVEMARENCGIDFSEEELEDAWNSLSR